MDHSKTHSGVSVGDIDWDDPYLSALLEKTAGWQLDNRIAFTPRPLSGKLSLFNVQVTDEELGALRSAGLVTTPESN